MSSRLGSESSIRSISSTSPRAFSARTHQQGTVYYPDTLVGTDSHTTMINGLGVVGWGVGGIEAEAGMLGQPVYFLTPEVVGVHLTGTLKEGVTATDLVLRVTEMLRKQKVVGKFVEFFGEGAAALSLPIEPQSAIWPPNTAQRWVSSAWTRKLSPTCAAPGEAKPSARLSRTTTRRRDFGESRVKVRSITPWNSSWI